MCVVRKPSLLPLLLCLAAAALLPSFCVDVCCSCVHTHTHTSNSDH